MEIINYQVVTDALLLKERLLKAKEALWHLDDLVYPQTSRQVIYHQDIVTIYRYQPKKKSIHPVPLLIVFALINRPEILDLANNRSFINGLLAQGIDVYLLKWEAPDPKTTYTLAHYICRFLHDGVQAIIRHSDNQQINLLGICQGGVFSLCYTALFKSIANLILMGTPVDFHTPDNLITDLLKDLNLDKLAHPIGTDANIPGWLMVLFFLQLKPFYLLKNKYLKLLDKASDDDWLKQFLLVEKWLFDMPDLSRVTLFEFIKEFYQGNNLIKSKIRLAGKKIDLAKVTLPVLNIISKDDYISPLKASCALKQYINSRAYTEQVYPCGHIGIYISQTIAWQVSRSIADWIKESYRNLNNA